MSSVISTQWLFIVFDGVMVVLAMYAFNIAAPGAKLAQYARENPATAVCKDLEAAGSSTVRLRNPDLEMSESLPRRE